MSQKNDLEEKILSLSFFTPDKFRNIAYVQTEAKNCDQKLPGVIFFGGFASDMDGTKAIALEKWAIESKRDFIRFDYTGHGSSSGEFLLGSIKSWFQDALDVLDNLTHGPQILVGSSMGGWIALLIAKFRVDRVHSFLGIAAAPDFTEDAFWANLTPSQKADIETRGYIESFPENLDKSYKISKALIFHSRELLIFRDQLILEIPVRFLQGSEDSEVSSKLAVKLLNHISCADSELTILKGADHRFSEINCIELIIKKIEELSLI